MKNSKLFRNYTMKDATIHEYSKEENNNTRVDLDKALANKLDREFKAFCKNLKKKSKQEIIDSAYELTVKEELKEELKNMNLYEAEKEMIFLQDDILNEFYHDWLNCDVPLGESLRDNLGESIATLTRYIGKRNNLDNER